MRVVSSTCGFRFCHEPPGHGVTGRFCAEHAELLGGVRVQLEGERENRRRFGHDRTRAHRGKRFFG